MKSFFTFSLVLTALGLSINNASAQKEPCAVIRKCSVRITKGDVRTWESAVNSKDMPICHSSTESYARGAKENKISIPETIQPFWEGYHVVAEVINSNFESASSKVEYMVQASLKTNYGKIITSATYDLKTKRLQLSTEWYDYRVLFVCSE